MYTHVGMTVRVIHICIYVPTEVHKAFGVAMDFSDAISDAISDDISGAISDANSDAIWARTCAEIAESSWAARRRRRLERRQRKPLRSEGSGSDPSRDPESHDLMYPILHISMNLFIDLFTHVDREPCYAPYIPRQPLPSP